MSTVYCIGECGIDIYVDATGTAASIMPGGRIANAAAILARQGVKTAMLGDAPDDNLGQLVVDFLKAAGVDTDDIDRPTDAKTPVTVYSVDGRSTRHAKAGDDGFDIVWPRIIDGDVVIYGGLHAIDHSIHAQLLQFLSYAAEHAIMIYLPGFYGQENTRITRIMPAIYEGLELADIVITRTADIKAIFNTDDDQKCFIHHLDFYDVKYINIASINGKTATLNIFEHGMKKEEIFTADSTNTLLINARIVADVAKKLVTSNP